MHDAYSAIVRASDEREQEIRLTFLKTPDAQDCSAIAEQLTAATGLPVRLVIRRTTKGVLKEMSWVPRRKESLVQRLMVVMILALPWSGGIGAGFLQLRPLAIVAVALALWLAYLCFLTVVYANTSKAKDTSQPSLLLSTFFTFFTFGAAYALAFVIGAYILLSR